MIGDTFQVLYVFGDPVDNPKIRQDGVMDGLPYNQVFNPIIGYYGETRINEKGEPRKHSGFDYVAPVGTAVKAIHAGTITKVRFGRWTKAPCAIRTWLAASKKDNKMCNDCGYKGQCKKSQTCRMRCCQCKYKGACYGIQLWLQWSRQTPQFAFYAHLSMLSDTVWNQIKDKIKANVSDYNLNIKVAKGDILGYAGCTGNACDLKPYQEHLHFEYRKENEDGHKDHPNCIVETKFMLEKGLTDMLEDRKKIDTIAKHYANKVIDKTARDTVFRHIDSMINTYISEQKL